MTALQLSEALGYASKISIDSLISRHKYIKEEEFSATCNMQAPDFRKRKVAFSGFSNIKGARKKVCSFSFLYC